MDLRQESTCPLPGRKTLWIILRRRLTRQGGESRVGSITDRGTGKQQPTGDPLDPKRPQMTLYQRLQFNLERFCGSFTSVGDVGINQAFSSGNGPLNI